MPELTDNSLLQFVVDLFYKRSIDPTSSMFLPTLIQAQKNPAYEPYVAGEWEPVSLDAALGAAAAVCTNQGGATKSYIVTPATTPLLTLSNVVIAGISNVLPAPATVTDDVVAASATLSTYPASVAPSPIRITGDFQLTQHCCQTDDYQTCAGSSENFVGKGTFAGEIKASRATISVLVTATGNELAATVKSLVWSADTTASNLSATVDITSIPVDAHRDTWNAYAEQALNSGEARSEFVANVQQVLAQQSTRDSLSQLITENLQSIMNET